MQESLRSLGLKIVAVANQKGGVGKTTTVAQVASGLAARGQRVLAVDGDPQGNLSLLFGGNHAPNGIEALLAHLASGAAAQPGDFILSGVRKGLDLLPSSDRALRRELGERGIEDASGAFSAFLDSLKERYDWILIDCSPSNGALESLLVRSSEAVIIPLEYQLFSVSGLEALMEDVRRCGAEAGRPIRVQALLFTKAEDKVARVATYREIFSSFKVPIFEVVRSEYIPKSLERSRTIWESAPSSYAARDYGILIEKAFME